MAINIIDKKQFIVDKEIQRLNADDLKDSWYYGLQYVKGKASYNLKDYKTATRIFKNLVKTDTQNDSYKDWLTYSKFGRNLWLVRIINFICAGLIITEMVFHSQIPNYYIRQTLLIIGILGLLSNWGYEHYLKRNFRKKTVN